MAEIESPRSQFIRDKIAARREMKHAVLDKNNPHFHSRYASLTSTFDACVEIYAMHGINLEQRRFQKPDGSWVLQTWREHVNGERDEVPDEQTLDDGNAQQRGSGQTYGRRYGASNIAVIASEEDDDGNAASEVVSRGTKLKSAAQIKQPDMYPTIEKAIRACRSVEELKRYGYEAGRIMADWREQDKRNVRAEYDRRMTELEEGTTEEGGTFKDRLRKSKELLDNGTDQN